MDERLMNNGSLKDAIDILSDGVGEVGAAA